MKIDINGVITRKTLIKFLEYITTDPQISVIDSCKALLKLLKESKEK